ncbi:MAG: valine--tRNA ligase [Acidimicrobiia bacterium]|nr:valine--tRNA ligase [Acidimicrobiia bacterium]MYC57414.1 valine--tRNA ligase [Acidimicrobiia bacterium]MYG94611.1 valine--tRNA ligase [Acidimicrobiia bacterium]MYI30252.1 valine--tRNA ligase [Acidimicrobiia bacterium]
MTTPRKIPEKPTLEGLEAKWDQIWETNGTYRFDRTATREQVYSIDTPPPTVSGSLHVGHIFSYTHTDTLARYHRMQGKQVYYPMGWDDNGLPTERRVQNYFNVRCDPSLPYDPNYQPPGEPGKDQLAISRRNFVKLCEQLTATDEQAFEKLWRHLGLSIDWSLTYATIDERSRRASQRAFLRNLARGEAYQSEAPSLWDVTFRTAVAQAELEDRERPGAYHRLAFKHPDGNDLLIDTTRPELLAACVAVVAHPDDQRYQRLFGQTITTPLFKASVPMVAHKLADPEKGTGTAMICTFGDTTDVIWWRELNLPVRAIVDRGGRIVADAPDGVDPVPYAEIAGRTINDAQQRIVELLAESGELIGEPRPITHPVKFFEKGQRPLEIVTSRQWYIRNGGRDQALRDALIQRGRDLRWVPEHMRVRYENWVEGLNGDWLISRQRFFGVPFPIWYLLDADGQPDYDHPIIADEADLPIDPSSDTPLGYTENQRDQPGGFTADPDVMDTWATSSLSPQIACYWEDDPDLFGRTFPMDLRPQAHEIIRTWLFATITRAHFEHDELPWSTAAISGWVLDPDRKKMSKSKGNVVTPMDTLKAFGADALRYWASSGRPGTDTAFEEDQMKVGRRLAVKILNASRFVLNHEPATHAQATETLDQALLGHLANLIDETTAMFETVDYARALENSETSFWSFTDDYLELVKNRAYGGRGKNAGESARYTLETALITYLKLFAPFLPFVTEEVWSWWQQGSVHRSPWPDAAKLRAEANDVNPKAAVIAADTLRAIRRIKSDAKVRLATAITTATITDTAERLAILQQVADDVADAGRCQKLLTAVGPRLSVTAKLETETTP